MKPPVNQLYLMDIGDELFLERDKIGASYEQVADATGIHHRTVKLIEKGIVDTGISKVYQLACFYKNPLMFDTLPMIPHERGTLLKRISSIFYAKRMEMNYTREQLYRVSGVSVHLIANAEIGNADMRLSTYAALRVGLDIQVGEMIL